MKYFRFTMLKCCNEYSDQLGNVLLTWNDKIVCFQNPNRSEIVQKVLYYNMQMRFLEFSKMGKRRLYSRSSYLSRGNCPPVRRKCPTVKLRPCFIEWHSDTVWGLEVRYKQAHSLLRTWEPICLPKRVNRNDGWTMIQADERIFLISLWQLNG